jgi:acyl-coenzyme A synthetase/AMP-(fatty) acid ligase
MSRDNNCTHLLLDRHVRGGLSGKQALVEVDNAARRTMTYGDLEDAVERAAMFLSSRLPHGAGARVMIIGGSTLEVITFWLATMRLGHVAVLVHPQQHETYYDGVLDDVRPALTFAAGSHFSFAERLPAITELQREVSRLAGPPCDVEPTAPALALLSSGSTGRPKVCVHPHAAFSEFHSAVTTIAWRIQQTDRILATSGPYFSFGLQGIHVPLSIGATAVLQPTFETHTDFLDTVQSEGVTVMLAVPTLFHLLWSRATSGHDLGSLRISLSAGERLPDVVRQRWERRSGSIVIDSIGTTETFMPYFSEHVSEPNQGLQPVSAFDHQLTAVAAMDTGDAQVSEIMVRSPAMMRGMLRGGQLEPRDASEWFAPADLFLRDGHRYHFVSRRGEGFKSGGLWVFPQSVEEALLAVPGSLLAAAVPIETEEGLLRVRAYAVLQPGTDAQEWLARAEQHVRQLRPKALKPESIRIVTALPLTPTGKMLRRAIA